MPAWPRAGSVVVSGVPAKVEWQEQFAPDAKERRKLVFTGRIPDMQAPGFGLPDFRFLSGPADAKVEFTQQRNDNGRMEIDLGIADTAIKLPALGWTKAPGVAGTAKLALTLDAKGLKQSTR